jgi:hypothetical protein
VHAFCRGFGANEIRIPCRLQRSPVVNSVGTLRKLRSQHILQSEMSEDPSGWSLTESDPQVFTQLLRDLGVKGLQVVSDTIHLLKKPTLQDDLYSLDTATLETLKPIHALIFLFKYVGASDVETSGIEVDPQDSGIWFANQVST